MLDIISIGDTSLDKFLLLKVKKERAVSDINKKRRELCFSFESKLPLEEVVEAMGGNAANVAVGLSRLGLSTTLLSHLGHDQTGFKIIKELKSNKVSLDQIILDSHTPTNQSFIISLYGERVILSHHEPRAYFWPKYAPPAHWLYLTSMSSGFEKMLPEILKYVEKNLVKVAFSPGTYQLSLGHQKFSAILAHCRVIFMNREEAISFTESTPKTPPLQLLSRLMKLGAETAVVTDGTAGAYGANSTRAIWIDLADRKPRLEATGAGDSFAAGTLAALMQGLILEETMLWGMLNSASVVQQIGAQAGLLHKHDMMRLVKKTQARIKEL